MGDNYAVEVTRQRRDARPARRPAIGEAEARRIAAEARTTQALDALDPTIWTVVKNLKWPGGRYGHVDHVVVGPSGIFVVDTEAWSGDVNVYGGHVRYEGRTEDSVVASLTEAASAVALLTPGVPQRLVKPVLCVSGAEDLDTNVGSLLVCSTDTLAAMLESRTHGMSTHQITLAAAQLRDHLHNRSLVKVAARAGQTEARRAKQPGFTPMRGVPVIRIAIGVWLAATLLLAPHVFTDAYTTIHDTVEQQIDRR